MRILAIESSSRKTSVAFLEKKSVLFSEHFFCPRRQTGPLFSTVERALAVGGRPDRIVVGTGPGSYSGVRAGIALALGLADSLEVPLTGVSSLLGLPSGKWLVLGDARASQIFAARIEGAAFDMEPRLITPVEAQEFLKSHRDFVPVRIGDLSPFEALPFVWPEAENLARLAPHIPQTLDPPVPLYLKPPHITKPALQKAARGS